MKLSSNYTYLFLDFETTGLDLTSDFPIQIAIIETDHNLKVLQYYCQYISLPESINKIKSNVSYMTGIDIDKISSEWLPLEKILEEIKLFFWENKILIGQNISFDIGFLKKFFPWCQFNQSIDTYELASSSIPYLKSYSLESIDNHLSNNDENYKNHKKELLNDLSKWEEINAHNALYDCINGISFMKWRIKQIERFSKEFAIVNTILSKTKEEKGISTILLWEKTSGNNQWWDLPTLTSPLVNEKKLIHETSIKRSEQAQHSKWSSKWVDLENFISELPYPCIIAVSHGSKIDIIKRACKKEQFDYLKEEQILDQDKLSLWCKKESYTNEEFLFILFYLAHHRDGYRVIQATLTTHKYILDYLQVKKLEIKKDKKILCTHWWLYYTIQNNPDRQETYKDYPICLLDADWRHTTYNDYAQRWIPLSSLLYQREKFNYEIQQNNTADQEKKEIISSIITSLSFFTAHFTKDSELYYKKERKDRWEISYIINEPLYTDSMLSWEHLQTLRNQLKEEIETPKYLQSVMEKFLTLLSNPVKIKRNMGYNNKDISYNISPWVRYIDFAEYLKLFEEHKVFFFSPQRTEYKEFLPKTEKKLPSIQWNDDFKKIEALCKESTWSIFIVSHNTEKSKQIFTLLHQQWFGKSHNLIGEYLTGGIAKNAIKQNSTEASIIIGWYHMLLHFRGEGNKIDHIIISYVPQWISKFIQDDIAQYALI